VTVKVTFEYGFLINEISPMTFRVEDEESNVIFNYVELTTEHVTLWPD